MATTKTYLNDLCEIVSNVVITDKAKRLWSLDQAALEFSRCVEQIKASSGKVILLGNGGSSAIVSHMQNDLCASLGVRAKTFVAAPLLTALSNDYGYHEAFERQLALWADPGDLVIAVSSSGESENILRATNLACKRGCTLFTLTGFKANNRLRQLGHLNFYVQAQSYGHVELAHSILTHMLTDLACAKEHAEESSFSPGANGIQTIDA